MIAGVCGGLAEHLGISTTVVRVAFVGLTLGTGGGGVLVYAFLWALAPRDVETETAAPQAGRRRRPTRSQSVLFLGVLLLVMGMVFASPLAESGFDPALVVPLLAVAIGVALAWSQLDGPLTGGWAAQGTLSRIWAVVRFAGGLALTVGGVVVLVYQGQGLTGVWNGALAALAVLLGVGGLVAPWVVRGYRRLQSEEAARVRATERADIAAHLHDSVLQTLALIQRRSDDPQTVQRLARSQERELRSWLYGQGGGEKDTLASAVAAVVDEIEDDHGVPVEVVVTGDRPLSGPVEALVQATREAVLNAVRHGSPPVSVFAEAGPAGVEVFVRDHGPGFDLGEIRPDRLGVRESILGRMDRHGGAARIRRLEHGTEVCLSLPPEPGPARHPSTAESGSHPASSSGTASD